MNKKNKIIKKYIKIDIFNISNIIMILKTIKYCMYI